MCGVVVVGGGVLLTSEKWTNIPYFYNSLARELANSHFQCVQWEPAEKEKKYEWDKKCSWKKDKLFLVAQEYKSSFYLKQMNLPPPFLIQRYGNRQMFPSPTQKPNIERMDSAFLSHFSLSSDSSELSSSLRLIFSRCSIILCRFCFFSWSIKNIVL